jgi:hypothetical protein
MNALLDGRTVKHKVSGSVLCLRPRGSDQLSTVTHLGISMREPVGCDMAGACTTCCFESSFQGRFLVAIGQARSFFISDHCSPAKKQFPGQEFLTSMLAPFNFL